MASLQIYNELVGRASVPVPMLADGHPFGGLRAGSSPSHLASIAGFSRMRLPWPILPLDWPKPVCDCRRPVLVELHSC